MNSQPKAQPQAFTSGKFKSFRKLNLIKSLLVLCILGLVLAQPGLLHAKSADITSIWNKMKPSAGNSSGPATAPTTAPAAAPATAPATSNDTAGKTAPKINIDYTEPQAEAAERLAKALTSAKTADEIRSAAYEALARSGMAIMSPDGVICQTGPRKIKRWLLPSQADNLAQDFLEHQGWTLATLNQAVAEIPDGPGPALLKRPETLGLLLKEWANIAQQSPDHPEAFAPMLLARIAQIRGGGADFTQEKIIPEHVELTYLELTIFTAGAFKSIPQSQGFRQSPDVGSVLAGLASFGASLIAQPAYAGDGNFCSWFKDNIGDFAQDMAESDIGFLMDQAIEKVGGWLEKVGDGALAKGLSHMGGALRIANLLTSMISMYGGLSLKMTWDPPVPHYLGNEHGDTTMKIIANVSTRPLADDATLACLKYIGIERPSSDSAKDTVVEWVALSGTPKHAQPKFPPSNRQNVSEDGTAVLELTMSQEALGEQVKKHGKIKKGQINMQANLIVYKSNAGKIIASALFGGVAGGNIEVLKQWFANWFPKRAVARVPVEYHKLSRWRLVIEGHEGLRIVLTSGSGTHSIWSWKIEGDPRWTGSGQFDLQSGSREFVMTPVLKDGDVTVNTSFPATATLGGTSEEPTLILGMKGNMNLVAKSEGGGGSVSHRANGEKEFKLEEIE